jgi:hypothetical protein
MDMRALGSRGGRSRRNTLTSKLAEPERQSLRQYLREQVDPAEVWTALKAALESGSQTAVVSAARLLVTELYEENLEERDFRARIRAEQDAHAEEARRKIEKLVLHAVVSIVRGETTHSPVWVTALAENLDAETKARITELKAEREALEAGLAGVRLQREEFVA